jgi:hypothetical protein
MIRFLCTPPLLAQYSGASGSSLPSGAVSRTVKSPEGRSVRRHQAPPFSCGRPAAGEPVIDSDGVVWLIESVEDVPGLNTFEVNVVKITQSDTGCPGPLTHHFSKFEFETFCQEKGIQLAEGKRKK